MKSIIEFRRGSATKQKGLRKVHVFNQSEPVYAEDNAFITNMHIISSVPKDDPLFGSVVILTLTKEGMNLFNEVSCNAELPVLILFINEAPFTVYRRISKIEKPEIMLTVADMDFANMLQSLIAMK